MDFFDLVVIGAGPGGYTAAIEAAKAGLSVALIEKQQLGGTCLNRGCIPTKALLKSAEVIRTIKKAADFGVNVEIKAVDWSKAVTRKDAVVTQLSKGIEQQLQASGVELIHGDATFVSEDEIIVNVSPNSHVSAFSSQLSALTIRFEHCVLAAGSRPQKLNIPGANLPTVYTSDNIMDIEQLPESLLIIGGGVIGIEMATIFNEFGVKITVLEYLPQILNGVDSDIVKRFLPMLRKQGISVVTGAKVERIIGDNRLTRIEYSDKTGNKWLDADIVLQATGRNLIEGLDLGKANIQIEHGWVATDESCRTTNPKIFAIGDINGKYLLAHAAEHQAQVVVRTMLIKAENKKLKAEIVDSAECINLEAETAPDVSNNSAFNNIPFAIFTHPEIACVGLTEDQCKQHNYDYVVGKALFGANGKAVAGGDPEGLVKLIVDKSERRLLGAHILGTQAACLLAELALAISAQITIGQIIDTIHIHPTLPEIVVSAARDAEVKMDGVGT